MNLIRWSIIKGQISKMISLKTWKRCWFLTYTSCVNTYKTLSLRTSSSYITCKSTEQQWWQRNARSSTRCKLKNMTNTQCMLKTHTNTWKNFTPINAKESKWKKMNCTNVWPEIVSQLILIWLTFQEIRVRPSKHTELIVMKHLIQRVKLLIGIFVCWWLVMQNIIKISVFTKVLLKFQEMEKLEISFIHWLTSISVLFRT